MFSKLHNPMSPKENQLYIWVSEYFNGYLSEFDLDGSNKENNFKDIDRTKLVRFGLIGNKQKMWFEVKGGTFNIFGRRYNFHIEDKEGNIYRLTSNGNQLQNDIITYKQAYAEQDRTGGKQLVSRIVGYYFGYKSQMVVKDIGFHFKPIVSLVVGKTPFIELNILSTKEIEGKLVVTRNNEVIEEFEGVFQKDKINRMNWQIKL